MQRLKNAEVLTGRKYVTGDRGPGIRDQGPGKTISRFTGFRVPGSGSLVYGLRFTIHGFHESRVTDFTVSEFRVPNPESRISGSRIPNFTGFCTLFLFFR
jgi:hypothetical protein